MGKVRGALVALLVFFCAAKVAFPQTSSLARPPIRDLKVSDIFIPAELAYVTETHEPTTSSTPHPIIIHIQEAHTNYEAQQHIIKILEQLIDTYGLKLILVEGSSGDAGLAYLRSYGPPDNRKEVAEKYLKAGLISAEEYLDITSDHPLTLWGIEDATLYDQHVEAFFATEALQTSLKPVLSAVRGAAETLRPQLTSPTLAELEAKSAAFDRQELALTDYATLLAKLAQQQGVGVDGMLHLARFLEVHRLEQAIDVAKVQQQQQALIAQLSARASEAELTELVEAAGRLKAGTGKAEVFYQLLQRLASANQIDLATFPQLAGYITYLQQSDDVSPAEFSKELNTFADTLRTRLASTPESQQLSQIFQELDLLEKLLNLRLSPQEYRQLSATDLLTIRSRWETFLNPHLARQGLAAITLPPPEVFEAQLPTLQRFYELAKLRDGQLVKNALTKLRESGEAVAVLITGGFHAPNIGALLKEEGVGAVVVTPKVTRETDDRLYRAVLRYKNGQGSLDEVMAIANQTNAQ